MYSAASAKLTTATTRPRSPETFDSFSERNAAAAALQSYEELSWHALQRNESLAQTRLHFRSVLAGFSAEDEAALVDWKEDTTPIAHAQSERRKGSSAGTGKEKERSSLGGGVTPGGKGKERERSSLGGASPASGSGRKKRRSAGVGS
ncbi:hypothetical protein WHR41_02006 [Cladosporium halotolerans]|uniref:Uncharacterized protein n=1 Tax=Cladosporium halotolerans TaxID=1052096 RepID=A0AB34KWV4_9PEZI